ncbi:MAG: hypothetical protein H7Y38_10485 [Armatimonadetes bacterium]|nr:hypothetical protein [Armatimonadota bacterium]
MKRFYFIALIMFVIMAGCDKQQISNEQAPLYDAGKESEQKAIVEKQQADAKKRQAAKMPPSGALPGGASMGGPPVSK